MQTVYKQKAKPKQVETAVTAPAEEDVDDNNQDVLNDEAELEPFEIQERHEVDSDHEISTEADLFTMVSGVRNITKLFHRSPKWNGFLQQNVVAAIGKQFQLKLDVKTRWNYFSIGEPSSVQEVNPDDQLTAELTQDPRQRLGMAIVNRKGTASQPLGSTSSSTESESAKFIKKACTSYAATKSMLECLKVMQTALCLSNPLRFETSKISRLPPTS